jgi:hypothetical protein
MREMTTVRFSIRYARYILTSLTTLAFGVQMQ